MHTKMVTCVVLVSFRFSLPKYLFYYRLKFVRFQTRWKFNKMGKHQTGFLFFQTSSDNKSSYDDRESK